MSSSSSSYPLLSLPPELDNQLSPEDEIVSPTTKQLYHHENNTNLYSLSHYKPFSIAISLSCLFLLFIYYVSKQSPPVPPLLVISIDGFRPDFLYRNVTPALYNFAHSQRTILAEYVRPSFPTTTFPNHYTLVTGKYPSEHGIVSNHFYDAKLNKSFSYASHEAITTPLFWSSAEPIWNMVTRLGYSAAVTMWPGSEAIKPSMYTNWKHLSENQSIAIIANWIDPFNQSGLVYDLPPADVDDWPNHPGYKRNMWQFPPHYRSVSASPPTFTAIYLPHVDHAGHVYGPDSIEENLALARTDSAISNLFKLIKVRKLWDAMNIVILSDHGMATTPLRISLKQALGPFRNVVIIRDKWPIIMLSPINPQDTPSILSELKRNANHYKAYSKTEIPKEFHYSDNARIPPIIMIPDHGYLFEDPDIKSIRPENLPVGMHGYVINDHVGLDMRAVFMARGPAFKTKGVANGPFVVPAFDNIEVYAILCKALGMTPNTNSGHGVPWM